MSLRSNKSRGYPYCHMIVGAMKGGSVEMAGGWLAVQCRIKATGCITAFHFSLKIVAHFFTLPALLILLIFYIIFLYYTPQFFSLLIICLFAPLFLGTFSLIFSHFNISLFFYISLFFLFLCIFSFFSCLLFIS
jgi:hypothetical protein